jgi:hypothetical protein
VLELSLAVDRCWTTTAQVRSPWLTPRDSTWVKKTKSHTAYKHAKVVNLSLGSSAIDSYRKRSVALCVQGPEELVSLGITVVAAGPPATLARSNEGQGRIYGRDSPSPATARMRSPVWSKQYVFGNQQPAAYGRDRFLQFTRAPNPPASTLRRHRCEDLRQRDHARSRSFPENKQCLGPSPLDKLRSAYETRH